MGICREYMALCRDSERLFGYQGVMEKNMENTI